MDDPIHLPALLSDIAGVSRSEVRRAIVQGEVKVAGKVWTRFDVPASALKPKGECDAPYIEHPYRDRVIERLLARRAS